MTVRPARPSRQWADLKKTEEPSQAEIHADQALALGISKDALGVMHELTTFNRNRPGDPDSALREAEACRMFVANLELRIARHWTRAAKGSDGGRADDGRR